MAAIDSVLSLMVQQDATELQMGADRLPKLLKGDSELSLTMPTTSSATLQTLLGELWSQHRGELADRGAVTFDYLAGVLGDFRVTLTNRTGGAEGAFDVSVVRARASAKPPAPQRSSAPPEPAPPAMPKALTGDPVTALLARAASMGASDLHLSESRPPVARIDGVLTLMEAEMGCEVEALLPNHEALSVVRSGRSVDFAIDLPTVGRFRVNAYLDDEGLNAAVRTLRRAAPPLDELGLPAGVRDLVRVPHGLIIACGPTGCGKSTTLAALAQQAMAGRAQVLISLEDPIEYMIAQGRPAGLVRQREIGTHVTDFATGLRDALREDPDILLIGEMRDPESIGLALTAAETGHLVLTSLHSRTSASAVERIVDAYPPQRQRQIRVQLADALRAVVAQRLLVRSNGRGRVPAVELLRVNHSVANMIREGKTAQIATAVQAGRADGMIPLEHHLAELVRGGAVRMEVARETANDRLALAEYLR